MALVEFETTRREPYADGRAFGDVGAYELIEGRATYAVDPADPANAGIVDLELAPTDGEGRVRFEGGIRAVVPADPARGSGRLLLDVPNRGRNLWPGMYNRANPAALLTNPVDAGDGFLFERGYGVISVGWQWDVPASDELIGFEAAPVDAPGLRAQIVADLETGAPARALALGHYEHRAYPAADLDQPDARLLVRDHTNQPWTDVPRETWRFARDENGPQPSPVDVYLESGFEPGRLYALVYESEELRVVGTGLLALRDAAVEGRAGGATPWGGGFEAVFGFGASQTGRVLRHFVYLGLNRDEAGRRAFDGLHVHIAGGRRGEFNHRGAEPSVLFTPSMGHLPPFSDGPSPTCDEGLLDEQRRRGQVPKIVYTNTSWEYWRGDASLLHIDPTRGEDLAPDPETRVYHFAGTQHVNGAAARLREFPRTGDRTLYDWNVVNFGPLARAALVRLDEWATEGVEPPPSAHPRIDDGTAISREAAGAALRSLPGLETPDPEKLQRMRRLDLGPSADAGMPSYPAVEGDEYPAFVSALDAIGNEVAGVALPDISVPVATHTGWNLRDPETGGAGRMAPYFGISLFLPADEAAGEASGDPRASVASWGSRADYESEVRQAARALLEDRRILEQDLELVVRNCMKRYELALEGVPAPVAGD